METNYDKILKATIELMCNNGYHGTSIQMIADNVGITKSTVFHHFKNKETILLSILDEYVPSATEGLKKIVNDSSLSGVEKLKRFILHHMKLVGAQGDIINLNLRESRYFGDKNRQIYEESQRVYARLVRGIVVQIQDEENTIFKGLNPKVVANAIQGMCNWSVLWYEKEGELDMDGIARQFYQILTCGISEAFLKQKSESILSA